MSVENVCLEEVIGCELLDFGSIILPFCDERFSLEYIKRGSSQHGLIMCDLKKSGRLIGYSNFYGVKEVDCIDNPGVENFYGFSCKVDDLSLSKRFDSVNTRRDANLCAYYVDKEYRFKGKKFMGVSSTLKSAAFATMKVLLDRTGYVFQGDYLYVARSSVVDFLYQTF